ncbi:MAG: PEP-CTERM sorting domain-containing protein [Phycisphaerae bacterium]|nr:PEP-CTERM sorting domain-containing protein [Phycisphaerae bacterium]
MNTTFRNRVTLALTVGAMWLVSAGPADAALITIDNFTAYPNATNTVNLTTDAPAGWTVRDWIKWGAPAVPNAIGLTDYARRAGTTIISDLTYIDKIASPTDTTWNDGTYFSTTEPADNRWTMTWTDGTGGSAGSPHHIGTRSEAHEDNNSHNPSATDLGEGFGFTVTADALQKYRLRFYVANYESVTTIQLSAPFASSQTQTFTDTTTATNHTGGFLEATWTPDHVGELLTVDYWMTDFNGVNGHYGNISVHAASVSVQPIPEPATMAFLALGGLTMIGAGIRRRRKA